MTSLTSFWIKFFKDAGIPVSLAATYAVTFTDNRIKADMLLDLTTELLSYMHIDVMGDVIAILKHAKKVHTEVCTNYVTTTPQALHSLGVHRGTWVCSVLWQNFSNQMCTREYTGSLDKVTTVGNAQALLIF